MGQRVTVGLRGEGGCDEEERMWVMWVCTSCHRRRGGHSQNGGDVDAGLGPNLPLTVITLEHPTAPEIVILLIKKKLKCDQKG